MEHERILTRDEFLQAQDTKKEKVYVPQLNGSVYVQGLTAADRDIWEDYMLSIRDASPLHKKKGKARALLVALSTVDEAGNKLFTLEDIEAIGQKSSLAIDRICKVAQRLSFVTEGDIEEAAKNS